MDVLTLNPSLLIEVSVVIVIGPPGVIGVEGARLEYQDKDGRGTPNDSHSRTASDV